MPLGSETLSTVPTKSYASAEKANKGKDKSKISAMQAAILLEDFGFVFSLWPGELFSDFAISWFIMDNIPSLIFKFILCLRGEVYQSARTMTSGLTHQGWRGGEEEDRPGGAMVLPSQALTRPCGCLYSRTDYRSPGSTFFMTSAAMTTSRPTPSTKIQLSDVRGFVWKMDCMKGMYTTARIENIDPAIPSRSVLLPRGFILNMDSSRERLLDRKSVV